MIQYLTELWLSAKNNVTLWTGIFTGALSLCGIYVGLDTIFAISAKWLIPILIVIFFVTTAFAALSWRLFRESQKSVLPKLLRVLNDEKADELLLMFEPSPLFGQNNLVSVYQKKDGFERFAGIGVVKHIQSNENIQIEVSFPLPNFEEFWTGIRNNEPDIIEKLAIKPSIPLPLLDGVYASGQS